MRDSYGRKLKVGIRTDNFGPRKRASPQALMSCHFSPCHFISCHVTSICALETSMASARMPPRRRGKRVKRRLPSRGPAGFHHPVSGSLLRLWCLRGPKPTSGADGLDARTLPSPSRSPRLPAPPHMRPPAKLSVVAAPVAGRHLTVRPTTGQAGRVTSIPRMRKPSKHQPMPRQTSLRRLWSE